MNLAMMLGIAALGLVVTRLQWLPGTAGVWGMSPGGAGAMVLLAEAYGGDSGWSPWMQYSASAVRRLRGGRERIPAGSAARRPCGHRLAGRARRRPGRRRSIRRAWA